MTVKDLNNLTKQLMKEGEGDSLVLLSSDGEGNSFAPFEDYSLHTCSTDKEVYNRPGNPNYEPEFDDHPGCLPAIVFWPNDAR